MVKAFRPQFYVTVWQPRHKSNFRTWVVCVNEMWNRKNGFIIKFRVVIHEKCWKVLAMFKLKECFLWLWKKTPNHNNDSNNTRFRLIEAHLNISITCFSLQLMLNPAESLFNWQKKTTLNDSVNVLSNHLFNSIVILLINLKLFHFRPRWQYKTSKWAFVCWTKLS